MTSYFSDFLLYFYFFILVFVFLNSWSLSSFEVQIFLVLYSLLFWLYSFVFVGVYTSFVTWFNARISLFIDYVVSILFLGFFENFLFFLVLHVFTFFYTICYNFFLIVNLILDFLFFFSEFRVLADLVEGLRHFVFSVSLLGTDSLASASLMTGFLRSFKIEEFSDNESTVAAFDFVTSK